MSKKYKAKDCVYCGAMGASQTADHVFAKGFFVRDDREHLPKVPSCEKCNNAKAQLEAYFTALLPFGGAHPDATRMLEEDVPRRLEAYAKLRKTLADESKFELITLKSGLSKVMTLPLDHKKLEELFRFVVKGLHFHHWQQIVAQDCVVRASALSKIGQSHFDQLLSMNGRRVSGCVGRNVFVYEGLQSVEHPWLSFWRFSAYGGLQVAGDPDFPAEATNNFYACSHRASMQSPFGD